MQHKLQQLAEICSRTGSNIVYDLNLQSWSEEDIQEFEQANVLLFRGYSGHTVCGGCHKKCFVSPKIIKYPDGTSKGVIICTDPDNYGRIEFDTESLRYWEINKDKLPHDDSVQEEERTAKRAGTLNTRIANEIIKNPNLNSTQLAKILETTSASIRTTPAWKMRKQFAERYNPKRGWKDGKGNMDAVDENQLTDRHWQIFETFQKYSEGKIKTFPKAGYFAEEFGISITEAEDLIYQTRLYLGSLTDIN